MLADTGRMEACEFSAEILATSPTHRNVADAYKWYYIAFSQKGFGVAFQDRNGQPPSYGGPVGDFRNEAEVLELVSELGFQRIQEIDAEAEKWLQDRHLTTRSNGP